MKAILKYPGGKWRIADWIISHFPSHKVYLEPFFGSGAVFFKKEPSYCEMTEDNHKKLLSALMESKSKIILSGYDSELYNKTLQGWNMAEIKTTAQMGLKRTEKIWFNFPNPNHEQMSFDKEILK